MNKIKRIGLILISALLSVILVLGASTAVAEQPQSSSEESICNPIGPQLNLIIHGNYPFDLFSEKVLPDGNYIFKKEYNESTIQYIANKKLTITDPTIFEPPSGCFSDASHDSSPQLMLSCVEEEFYVAGRIQPKSNRDQNPGFICSSLLCPNLVIEAYTDTHPANTHFLNYKEYSDGLVPSSDLSSIRHVYNAAPQGFVRSKPTTSEEEKSSAITPLFKWLGWVCRMIFVGTDEDGDIDAYGVTFVKTD